MSWLIVIITILFSAFFSGMEIAYISSNKLRIEIDKQKGVISGNIFSTFLNAPSKLITTLLLGNNIALVIFGISMSLILEEWLTGMFPALKCHEFLLLLIQTIIATIIILITAEFIPKIIFRLYPNRIIQIFAVPVYFFYLLFYPVAIIFIWLSRLIIKGFLGISLKEERYHLSSIDLESFLLTFSNENEENTAYEQEIQMIQNAIDFRTVKLKECMVPRTEIVAMDIEEPIEKLKKRLIESVHSKILIYKDSIDNLIGYVHSFDLFNKPKEIRAILRPLLFVPETMLANTLMEKFIKERKSIAVVVDEFGGTAGMLTLEDVIEEIFGEIEDEFDTTRLLEKRLSDKEYIFEARIEIDHLNQRYGFHFPESEEYETLAGYIIHHHKSIPAIDEVIEIDHWLFTITEATENKIKKVKVTAKS
ncbi:MAG: hemolysin family protein [Bacteroidales bacterium]|nr:hemolysin family protein [Bacteroidales bacterium]